MSNLTLLDRTKSLIDTQKVPFATMAKIHGAVEFEREASFAMQSLSANPYLLKVACENPDSLKQAVLNVAAIGLSLSPVHKHAYLVPRKGKVCLDLSYKGLVQLATDSGFASFVVAKLVYEKDRFIEKGIGQEPVHEYETFNSKRGKLIGAYAVAKLHSGDFLVETMTIDEIYEIRDRSDSYIAYKTGKVKSTPWATDEGEMCKKTVIRRASKSWTNTDSRKESRFGKAINIFDETEAIDIESQTVEQNDSHMDLIDEKLIKIRELLVGLERSEEKFLGYLEGVNNRKIETLEELSLVEAESAVIFLNQIYAKREKVNETA